MKSFITTRFDRQIFQSSAALPGFALTTIKCGTGFERDLLAGPSLEADTARPGYPASFFLRELGA